MTYQIKQYQYATKPNEQARKSAQFQDNRQKASQLKCAACLEEEKQGQTTQRQVIQRIGSTQKVKGSTHIVKMNNGSIMEGENVAFLHHGTLVNIIPESKIRSRRGPNQEEFGQQDRERGTHIYYWYALQENPQHYIREDALQEFAAANETKANTELTDITKIDQRIEQNKKTPPFKFLKAESVLHVTGGLLKMIAGIALGTFGAIHALIGQFVGGVSAIAIGVMKWVRANASKVVADTQNALVSVYQKMRNYVVRGQRGQNALSIGAAETQASELEAKLDRHKEKVNQIRVAESVVGLIGAIGNCISGAFVACLSIVPNLMKAARSIAQLRGKLTDSKTIGRLVQLESVISGLLAIFSLEEGIRSLRGGSPAAGKFGVSYNDDPKSDAITVYKAGVGGIGSAITGDAIAGAKYVRGENTKPGSQTKADKETKKSIYKKQIKEARRIRKSGSDIRNGVND